MVEEGVFHGDTGGEHQHEHHGMGDSGMGSMNNPAEWPRAAEEMSKDLGHEISRRGWWPTFIAALGSIATIGGALMFARRRRRSGIMGAMPSQIADASEQMMHMKPAQMMMRGRSNSGGSWWRTMLAIGAFAAAGWGIRRKFAQQA